MTPTNRKPRHLQSVPTPKQTYAQHRQAEYLKDHPPAPHFKTHPPTPKPEPDAGTAAGGYAFIGFVLFCIGIVGMLAGPWIIKHWQFCAIAAAAAAGLWLQHRLFG